MRPSHHPGPRSFRSAMAGILALLLAAVMMVAVSAGTPAAAGSPYAYDPSCQPPAAPDPATAPTRVLINGDSMTNGFSGDFTWRYFFYQHLVAAGANVDFVGPFSDLIDKTSGEWGNHEYAACDFDQDHFARGGGKLVGQIAVPGAFDPTRSTIQWAVNAYQPDVVVEYFGYNDLIKPRSATNSAPYSVAEVIANAKTYVDQVRSVRPNATIVMAGVNWAQIPTNQPDENKLLVQRAPQFNAALKNAIANTGSGTWQTPTSKVVYADVERYWNGYGDTYDGSHPTSHGEGHIAQGMEAAFWSGLGIGAPPNLDEALPPVGPRVAPVLTATATATRLSLRWTPPPGATRMLVYCREVAVSTAWTQAAEVAHTTDPASNGASLTSCRTGQNVQAGHGYQVLVRAAKGTAIAVDLSSNRVDLVAGVAPTPTPTVTPTATPTVTPTATPTDPTQSPTPTSGGTGTVTPEPSITVSQGPALGRVAGLVARPGNRTVGLTWTPVPGATGYTVAWRRSGETSYRGLATTTNSHRFTSLASWQTYNFLVRATGPTTVGAYSAVVSAKPTGVLATPARPVLTRLAGRRVAITWKAVPHATRYQVQYRVGSGAWKVIGSSRGTRFICQGLVKGRTYGFRVRAFHGAVAGGVSTGSRITGR